MLKIRVCSKKEICWFFVLLCFFESPYLERFSYINLLFNGMKILSVLYVISCFRHIKIDGMFTLIMTSEIASWFSTLIMRSPMITMTFEVFSVALFCLTVNLMVREDAKTCIRVLCIIFELLVYINFFSMLFFPNGLYIPSNYLTVGTRKYYFLGHQNAMAIYSVVAITLQNLRIQMEITEKQRTKGKRRRIALAFVSIYYSIRVWSVISILSTIGILSFLAFEELSNHGFRISLIWSIIANIFLFFSIAVLQNFNIFSKIIMGIFNREATLSGRTRIWSLAFNAFLQSPLWGVGKGQGIALFGLPTAHNRYMNTLFTSGIIGMFFLLMILFCLHKKLQNTDEKIVRIFLIFFTILLLAMQGETYEGYPFYMMIILGYNSLPIIEQKVMSKNQRNHFKDNSFQAVLE